MSWGKKPGLCVVSFNPLTVTGYYHEYKSLQTLKELTVNCFGNVRQETGVYHQPRRQENSSDHPSLGLEEKKKSGRERSWPDVPGLCFSITHLTSLHCSPLGEEGQQGPVRMEGMRPHWPLQRCSGEQASDSLKQQPDAIIKCHV